MPTMSKVRFVGLGCVVLGASAAAMFAVDQASDETTFVPIDNPAIQYYERPPDDAAARLNQAIESGKVKLEYRPDGRGYLSSLLEHLKVNPDSQVMVFSKTSFQAAKISPRAPRALYFNDS